MRDQIKQTSRLINRHFSDLFHRLYRRFHFWDEMIAIDGNSDWREAIKPPPTNTMDVCWSTRGCDISTLCYPERKTASLHPDMNLKKNYLL
jgi:hypothetical protein